MKSGKTIKRVLIVIGGVLGVIALTIAGYAGYILISYNRIGDKELNIDAHSSLEEVKVGDTYKAMSYNIGFGAYSQDFTFFLDTGYDEKGKTTCGHWSTAKDKKTVLFNVDGAIKTTVDENPDFVFFQEVDTKSTRSYRVNQDKKITESYADYDHIHAVNFHSAFLPYPLYDMHGYVNAGLTTISKYKMQKAERKSYTISSSLSKLFDLDRCFSYATVKVDNGKTLYIVNSHMSAYDDGGSIRSKQVQELNDFLAERTDDYVIIGGDWNHDLLINNPDYAYDATNNRPFSMTLKTPDWLNYYFDEDHKSPLIDGYRVIASDNSPTCRNNDIQWDPDVTFRCVVDGFIVSSNIEVVNHKNIMTKYGNKGLDGFAYADHEPAVVEFKLL